MPEEYPKPAIQLERAWTDAATDLYWLFMVWVYPMFAAAAGGLFFFHRPEWKTPKSYFLYTFFVGYIIWLLVVRWHPPYFARFIVTFTLPSQPFPLIDRIGSMLVTCPDPYIDTYMHIFSCLSHSSYSLYHYHSLSGWWFGSFLKVPLGIFIIPTDNCIYFSEGWRKTTNHWKSETTFFLVSYQLKTCYRLQFFSQALGSNHNPGFLGSVARFRIWEQDPEY